MTMICGGVGMVLLALVAHDGLADIRCVAGMTA
jgi:hypothetical protein